MAWLSPSLVGVNFIFWILMGVARFLKEEVWGRMKLILFPRREVTDHAIKPNEVAVIMAAYNEEIALLTTIKALLKNVGANQIYIGSDASSDATLAIAKNAGCNVVELRPNRGKAKVLTYLLNHFNILDRYKAVLIMDAEVVVSDNYLQVVLPFFNDAAVVAFVSHCRSRWRSHCWPQWSMFFTAYRVRLWLVLYYGLRYGQTWKYVCATPIIPGGSSVYRSSALRQIEIDTPGMIIEDFNMTFQVYHKRLGRIASHPSAYIVDQEPYSMRDYISQVDRWFLGFWQTALHHGFWPSFFWFATFFFVLEMCVYAVVILATPFLIAIILVAAWYGYVWPVRFPVLLEWRFVSTTVLEIIFAFFILDYITTVIVAAIKRKPMLLIYGLGFFILRYVDSFIFLWTFPLALLSRSEGKWVSPKRRV